MSESPKILVVDDEHAIRRYLKTILEASNYIVYEAADGMEAMGAILTYRPDLIILDLGLPDMDGVEITRKLREWSRTPIIILSVRDQDKAKIEALDSGADDYLTKPFSSGELMARIRAALRHMLTPENEPVMMSGELVIDQAHRTVTVSGNEISLTKTEYDILRLLLQNKGKVLTHRQILRRVWGPEYETETHMLRVNISNIRQKIEVDPSRPGIIRTEPGVGYRLRGETE